MIEWEKLAGCRDDEFRIVLRIAKIGLARFSLSRTKCRNFRPIDDGTARSECSFVVLPVLMLRTDWAELNTIKALK